jgi:hypothetical protein
MYMSQAQLGFRKPDLFERMLNKGFRALVALGLGHNYLLEVQGRKTYRVYSTPVDLLELWRRASSLLLADAHHGSVTPRAQIKSL